MFPDVWLQRPLFKYLTGFVLVMSLLLLAEQAWTFIEGSYTGVAPKMESIGTFVLFAALCPLYMAFFVRIKQGRSMPDIDEGGDRSFSESLEGRALNIFTMWSLGVGLFVNWVASGASTSDMFDLFPPVFFVLIVVASGFAMMRRTLRLDLSAAGIEINAPKAALIAWPDVRDVKLVKRLGSSWISVSVDNAPRYGLKKSTFNIMPGLLGTPSEQIYNAIERRRAMFAPQAS